jgi:hypothetical protein
MKKKRNFLIILAVVVLISAGSYFGGIFKKDLVMIVPIVPYFFL